MIEVNRPPESLSSDPHPADAGRATARPGEAPRRVLSLDAFRGIVIAGMLLVNNIPGNATTPRQLMHAPWGAGVTFTDMILPWFILAMGVAIPLSGAGRRPLERADRARSVLRVVRRTAVLVLLGIFLDSLEYHRLVVGMDVLQLLGLAYLVAALLKGAPAWVRLCVGGGLLAGHWVLLTLVPVPGYGAGVFLEHHNLISYLDDTYLARYHLYHPAGVISVLPATALALLGTAAGDLLRTGTVRESLKCAVLVLGGLALGAGGGLAGRALLLSKFLWTPSYVLVCAGLGLLVLAGVYLVLDIARLQALGVSFAVFGSNAILAYVAPIVFHVEVLDAPRIGAPSGGNLTLQTAILDALARTLGPRAAMWVYPGAIIAAWWLALLYLYRRRIRVRV